MSIITNVSLPFTYFANVGIHAATVRITYTVPGGRTARIKYLNITYVSAAANPQGSVEVRFVIKGVIIIEKFNLGGVNEVPQDAYPLDILLNQTENVQVLTSLTAGPNVTYQLGLVIEEQS